MLLSELVQRLSAKRLNRPGDTEISSIVYDSRCVPPGSLFACIRGSRFDGHDFIDDALRSGALAVLVDRPERVPADVRVPVVVVPDTRQALPILANRFYGHPSRRLKLIGVTGTNGKTTTTYLTESVLRHAGQATGVIGTLGARICGEQVDTERTTPESVDLQQLLVRMVSAGVEVAAMEVSSHALAMQRAAGCEFDVGVFTNLTQDHLDFHNSLEDYFNTKLILFREYPKASNKQFTGIVNIDDPGGEQVVHATHGAVMTYGIHHPADVRAFGVRAGTDGIKFHVVWKSSEFSVRMNLGGLFNVYNSLAAVCVGLTFGLDMDEIRAGLEAVPAVAGRFEAVDCGQDFAVIVDYAHTPDGLENVLRSARGFTKGRLIVVFGCGGDRDRAKRPIMGRIASDLADVCVVTSDNPRSERPEAILGEIVAGVNVHRRTGVEVVPDRRGAIKRALDIASPGDLVLIAGKGHETYQIFEGQAVHFDDREAVREILSRTGMDEGG